RDFAIYTTNNIEATQVLLEAVTRAPALERMVYASSSSIYGDNTPMPFREDALPQPVSPYGVSKLAAEQLCYLYFANYRVPATSLRYFTVHGPRQRPDRGFHKFLRAAIRGDATPVAGRHTVTMKRSSFCLRLSIAAAAIVAASACAGQRRGSVPAGTTEPDKFLFDRGTSELAKKKWLTAREYLKQVTETYTQSAYR